MDASGGGRGSGLGLVAVEEEGDLYATGLETHALPKLAELGVRGAHALGLEHERGLKHAQVSFPPVPSVERELGRVCRRVLVFAGNLAHVLELVAEALVLGLVKHDDRRNEVEVAPTNKPLVRRDGIAERIPRLRAHVLAVRRVRGRCLLSKQKELGP